MGMAVKIKMLLAARGMTMAALADKLDTTPQNLGGKMRRDNFSEKDLIAIAEVCDAVFEGSFVLKDTGKEI